MKRCLLITTTISILACASGCTKPSADAAAGKITGTVTVSPALITTLKDTDVLYIIARGEQVGPPTAVKRIVRPQFPLKYMIGPEDVMIPGTPGFEPKGNLTVAARISRTGNAMPSIGDLEGVYRNNPAHPGTGGVDIAIEQVRQ